MTFFTTDYKSHQYSTDCNKNFKWHFGGCLTYNKCDASRRRSSTRQNNSLKLGKKTKLKAERIGAFAAKPLCESPRNLRTAAYLSWKVFFTPTFHRSLLFRAAFFAPSFFIAIRNYVHASMAKVRYCTQSSQSYPKVSGKVCYILFSYFV